MDTSAILSLIIRAKNEAGPVLNAVGQSVVGLRKSTNEMFRAFTSLKSLAVTGLGLAGVGLSARAVVGELKALVDELEALNNTAQNLGIDPQEFLELDYATRAAGQGSDVLRNALARLDVLASENAEALTKLGISLDGLTATEKLKAIATALAGIENQADRTKAATEIFGAKLAQRILPVLNSDLDESARRFERLGGVIISDAIPSALAIGQAFDEVGLASQAVKAALLIAFGPDIQAVLTATAEHIADNREETVAWAEATVPTGESIVEVVSQIGGAFAGMAKTVELAVKSSVLLLVALYNEAAKIANTIKAVNEYQVLAAEKEGLRLLDVRITNLRESIKEYERLGSYYQNVANDQAIVLEYSQKIKQANLSIAALEATRATKTNRVAKAQERFQYLAQQKALDGINVTMNELVSSIVNAGTITEAWGGAFNFVSENAKKLLETARAIRAERAKSIPSGGDGSESDPADKVLDSGILDKAAGAGTAQEREDFLRRLAELTADARRTVDDAIAGSESAPFAEREAAMRRIVEAEIEAERVRYQSVLTETELVNLAEARRAALDGQLNSMREASILASSDIFGGFAVGLGEAARSMTLASASADFAGQAFTSLQQTAAGALQSIKDGTFDAGEAVKEFVMSIINSLIQLVAQMLVTIAVATLLNILLPGSGIALGAASNSLVKGTNGVSLFDSFKSSAAPSATKAVASGFMAPGVASPSQSIVQTNVTNIQAVDAPSFQRLLARNSASVAETVASEGNDNGALRRMQGR